MEDETERWRPVLGIEEILVSVISLIMEPNINSPANVDAAVNLIVLSFHFFFFFLIRLCLEIILSNIKKK